MPWPYFYKLCGIIGLLLVTKAIFIRGHRHQSIVFAAGGLFLLVYSVSLGDTVFIVLQSIFILSSAYEWYVVRKKNSTKL
jgi:lipid-A-disaccharide synthase-like uncharacterized protein